MHKVANQSS